MLPVGYVHKKTLLSDYVRAASGSPVSPHLALVIAKDWRKGQNYIHMVKSLLQSTYILHNVV